MTRRIAIADIHGCATTFEHLLFDVVKFKKTDKLFLLGDYIDRGPRSKETLDLMMKLEEDGYEMVALRGNHEQMLLDSIVSVPDFDLWHINGCNATLESFGVLETKDIEGLYLNYISSMPYYHVLEDFVLVHGGLNFDLDDPLKDVSTMLWMRNAFVPKEKIGGRKMVVGHTPVPLEEIRTSLNTDKFLIDGGCCYHSRYNNLGKLVALDIDTREMFVADNLDK